MVGKFFASLLICGIVNGCGSRSARGRGSDDKPARGPTYNQRHSDEEERGSVYESARGSDESVLSAYGESPYIVPGYHPVVIPPKVRGKMPDEFAHAGLHLPPSLFETYIPGATYLGNEIPIYLTSQTETPGERNLLVAKKSVNGVCQRTEGFFMFGLLHSRQQKTYVTIITSNIGDDDRRCDDWSQEAPENLIKFYEESLRYKIGTLTIHLVVYGIIKSIFETPQVLTSIPDRNRIRIRAILVSEGPLKIT